MSTVTPDALHELAASSGVGFLSAVVRAVHTQLDAICVAAGELRLVERDRIRVLTMHGLEYEGEGEYEYDLCVAPCSRVIAEARRIVIEDDVRDVFPDDAMLANLPARSYVGIPLFGSDGRPIGLIATLTPHVLKCEEVEQRLDPITEFLARASIELQNLQAHRQLAALSATVNAPASPSLIEALNLQLCEVTLVRASFVSECSLDNPDRFRVLACAISGENVPGAVGSEFSFANTPCDSIRTSDTHLIASGLQARFPHTEFYGKHNLHAYFGHAIRDAHGRTIGHVALLHDREISPDLSDSHLLDLLIKRIGLELQHRHATEERRRFHDAQLVRRKTESLDLLIGTIAHDFNNILAASLSYAEAALANTSKSHAAHEDMTTAKSCMLRARELTHQLLDYARESPDLRPTEVDLNQLVRETLPLVPPARSSRGLTQLCLDEGLPRIRVDKAQVVQVVLNLIINAFDALRDGGSVRISTKVVKLDERDVQHMWAPADALPETCVMLEVRDSGVGMDSATAVRAFDPFFTTKPAGRGLGMATVQGVVRRHEAGLTLASARGEGTSVRVFFPPVTTTSEPKHLPNAVPLAVSNQGAVMVVDDDPLVLQATRRVLEVLGIRVVAARSAEEAVRALDDGVEVWAALLDVAMPGRDGWETLGMIRSRRPKLPVIMMSGFAVGTTHRKRSVDHDVRILDKPFTADLLRETLSAIAPNAPAE